MGSKIKHLEIIQGVINRQAQNAFQIKSWSVVLVSSLFALSSSNTNLVLWHKKAKIFFGAKPLQLAAIL